MWIRSFTLWSCDFHWHLHIKFYNPVCESNHSHNNWFNLGHHLSSFGPEKQFGHLSSAFSTSEAGLACLLQGISTQGLTTADKFFGEKTDKKNPVLYIYSSHLLLSWEISIVSLEQTKAIKNEPKNKCKNRLAAKEFTYSIFFFS